MSSFTIRAFTPSDYAAVVAIHNTLYPDRPVKAADLLQADVQRDPLYHHQRQVAEQDGQIVGYAVYYQSAYAYHPRKFGFGLNVLPDYQQRGIGSALYEWLLIALRPFDPLALTTKAYENLPGGMQFMHKRGFVEVFRERKSELDLTAFDPAPYAELRHRLSAEGIEITTLQATEGDPTRDPALYALERAVMLDIPGVTPETLTWPAYAAWLKDRDDLQPETYFLARHQGKYIGLSYAELDEASHAAYQWLTGVDRAYRQRGIALLLKLSGILSAQAAGYPVIRTSTSVENVPILKLNEQLGYAPLTEWVELEKTL